MRRQCEILLDVVCVHCLCLYACVYIKQHKICGIKKNHEMWMFWRSKQKHYPTQFGIRQQLYNSTYLYLLQYTEHISCNSFDCLCHSLHASRVASHWILCLCGAHTRLRAAVWVWLCSFSHSRFFYVFIRILSFIQSLFFHCIIVSSALINVARCTHMRQTYRTHRMCCKRRDEVNNNITKSTTHKHSVARSRVHEKIIKMRAFVKVNVRIALSL